MLNPKAMVTDLHYPLKVGPKNGSFRNGDPFSRFRAGPYEAFFEWYGHWGSV